MALTKNVTTKWRKRSQMLDFPVKGGVHIYEGGLCSTDSTGFLVPAADTAGHKFQGRALQEADNTNGSNGDIVITVRVETVEQLKASGATQAWVGQAAYIVDDETVAISGTTNSIEAGEITKFVSSTVVEVSLRK